MVKYSNTIELFRFIIVLVIIDLNEWGLMFVISHFDKDIFIEMQLLCFRVDIQFNFNRSWFND